MRVALFTPYLPLPAVTGGRIRVARLAEGLARRAEVELFAVAAFWRGLDPTLRRLHADAFLRTHVGLEPAAALLARGRPRRVARCDSRRLARAFRRRHREAPFDAAVVAHSYAAPIALRTGIPVVVDEHNVESRFFAETARARGEPEDAVAREVDRLARWERQVWRQARAVTCVAAEDAAHVEASLGEARPAGRAPEVMVIPNGVALRDVPFRSPSARTGSDVLFVALMTHPPNVRAAVRLAERIMPLVWRDRPDARLVLCGHDPRPVVRALAGPRVEVTGTVPAVAPYLDRARVVVSPLDHGAGTSLKVVEALASGAPFVSSAVGLRGYPDEIRDLATLAEDDAAWAAAILHALGAGAPDDARAERARRFAARYDWSTLADAFAAVVARARGG